MITVAKFQDKIVEIVRVADAVQFSSERGWVCITQEVGQPARKQTQFKWVPASTRFDWVREFSTEV
jgi:hypothetical protein